MTWRSNPAFRGRVITVTKFVHSMAILPGKDIMGSVLALVGPVSVYRDWET